jgi:hypothetical protein
MRFPEERPSRWSFRDRQTIVLYSASTLVANFSSPVDNHENRVRPSTREATESYRQVSSGHINRPQG